jgi:hypothetical protein
VDLLDLFKNSESPSISLSHEQIDANWTGIESRLNTLISDVDKVVERRNQDIVTYSNGSVEVSPDNLQPAGEAGQIFIGNESGFPSFQTWDARGEYVPLAAAQNINTKPVIVNPEIKSRRWKGRIHGDHSPDIYYKFAHLDAVEGNRIKAKAGGVHGSRLGTVYQDETWANGDKSGVSNISEIFIDYSRFNTGDRVCFISDTRNGNLYPNRVCYIRRHISGATEKEEAQWASFHYTKEGALTDTEVIQLEEGVVFNNNAFISAEIAQCSGVPGGRLFYRPIYQTDKPSQRYHPSSYVLVFNKRVDGNYVFIGSGRKSMYVPHRQWFKKSHGIFNANQKVDAIISTWDMDRGIPIIYTQQEIQSRIFLYLIDGGSGYEDKISEENKKFLLEDPYVVSAVESSDLHVSFIATNVDLYERRSINSISAVNIYGGSYIQSLDFDVGDLESLGPPKYLSFRVLKYS